MEIANDPDAGAAELQRAMETDVALSARVLRHLNSSAYGLRGKVTNLLHAIAYLGTRQIRNLAMTAAVSRLFAAGAAIGPYRREGLWRHCVAVGICARMIALRMNFLDFEDVFLAGLLHDVGIVLEDQHAYSGFHAAMESLAEGNRLVVVEREHLGFDHAALGDAVAKEWGFPESVRAAIRYHHAPAAYDGPYVNTVRCVDLANLLCTAKGISSVGLPLVELSKPTLDALSLGREDILVLSESLDAEMADKAGLFAI